MIYDVRHGTTFSYEDIVSVSHHVLHLVPRSHPRQRCLDASVLVEPPPSMSAEGEDYFGNPVQYLTVQQPHRELSVESRSRVEVFAAEDLGLAASPPWETLRQLPDEGHAAALEAYEFAFDSPCIESTDEVRDYAARSFPPGRPLLEGAMELTGRIYREFEYRGGVSDVSTPVREVLKMRQGVCQDFAHLEIACLRSMGLPARYVSGYLLTRPPAGQEKLIGADASHAWVSVWAGEQLWVDFDPTNDLMPGAEHITLAWGRDYGDVSPINGFIVGGGAHSVAVAVDVTPVDATTPSG